MPSNGRATQRLRYGGSRRSPRLTSATNPSTKSTKSTSRLNDRTSRRRDESQDRRRRKQHLSHDLLGDDDEGLDRDDERQEINATRNGEGDAMCSTLTMLPEKSVLELVIDILQRRDTYEAFGEPIDPDKVRGYYAVVKEPMDFGTMRAKLHEGLYTSLKEFEHDAFLIPQNAMLFNPTNNVYFKQARAIEELAKKVFFLLRTEPEKLRTDFSGTSRRSRRLPPESVNGKRKRGSSTDVKPQNKTTLFSSSNVYKPTLSTSLNVDKVSTHSLIVGGTCANRDCRSTYQPQICLSKMSDSVFSMVYRSSKLLEEVRVGEAEVCYRDSLMRFTRGLGPIAQKIAAKKLQPHAKVPDCYKVQLQPATFQYPAISPIQEQYICPSSLASSSGGDEKVSAQENHRGGICLALRSEKSCDRQARNYWRS